MMVHEAIIAAAPKAVLPAAWLSQAAMVVQPNFTSIFNGASRMLYTLASKFGLNGMPPINKASKSVPLVADSWPHGPS